MASLSYRFGAPLKQLRADIEHSARSWPLAQGTSFEAAVAGGVPCEWIRPSSPVDACSRIMMYIHGGGYYRSSSRAEAAACSYLASWAQIPILSVNYRRAPDEGVFPAAVDDVHAAFKWAADDFGASNIVVSGTSAGGGLALALLLRLKSESEAQPAAAFTMSPWTDMTQSGQSYDTLAEFGPTRDYLQHWGREYLQGESPENPEASPLFGDLRGLPPLLIQVGGHEAMLDDSTAFAAAAAQAGCDVTLQVYREQRHGFQHEAGFNPVAASAVRSAAAFACEALQIEPAARI